MLALVLRIDSQLSIVTDSCSRTDKYLWIVKNIEYVKLVLTIEISMKDRYR